MSDYILDLTFETQWAIIIIITMHNNFISRQLLNQAFLYSWIGAVGKRASFANRLWHVQVELNNSIANILCLPLMGASFDCL